MVTITILRDNREKLPWEFENFDVTTRDVTLRTGDYTLAEFCDHDEENDTYYPEYAIERKNGDDFMSSITRDMDRFQDEIRRASDWSSPLLVVVEEPKTPSRYQRNHFIDFYEADRDQVFATVDTLETKYNVQICFAGDRGRAQRMVHSTLLSRLRSVLTSED